MITTRVFTIEVDPHTITCGLTDEYIQSYIDNYRGKCVSNVLIVDILEYEKRQKYINMNSTGCNALFDIIVKCSVMTYYKEDLVMLYVDDTESQIIKVSNKYISGVIQKTTESGILTISNLPFVGIVRSVIYQDSEKIFGSFQLYTPKPIVYKITYIGPPERSDRFNEYLDLINKIYDNISSNPNYKILSDHLFLALKGTLISLDEALKLKTFFLHANSIHDIPIYKDIKANEVISRTYDEDYLIIYPLYNRMTILQDLLTVYDEYQDNTTIWNLYQDIKDRLNII